MAVVQNFNNYQNQQQQTQQGTNSSLNQPVNVSGSTASPTTAGPGTSGTAAPTAGQGTSNNSNPTSSGSFTNLQNYLNANSNYNQAGGGLAGQINSSLNNQANTIQNNFNADQQSFQNQANQGQAAQYNPNLINQAVTDSANFVTDPNNMAAWNAQLNAQYKGPNNFQNASQYQQGAQNLQNLTNLTTSDAGRYTLLNSLFGSPQYNSGQQGLDNLILSGNPNQMNALQGTRSISNGLSNTINSGISQDQNLVNQYQNEAQNTQAQAKSALYDPTNGAIPQFDKYAQNLAQQDITNRQNAYNDMSGALTSGHLSQAQAAQLGINGNQSLYNVDPNSFLQMSNQSINAQNAISAADYAKIQALSQLAGNTATGNNSAILQSYSNPALAGQATAGPQYTFNNAAFQNAIRSASGNYQNSLNNIITNLYNQNPGIISLAGIKQMAAGWTPQNAPNTKFAQQYLAQKAALDDIYNPTRTLTVG